MGRLVGEHFSPDGARTRDDFWRIHEMYISAKNWLALIPLKVTASNAAPAAKQKNGMRRFFCLGRRARKLSRFFIAVLCFFYYHKSMKERRENSFSASCETMKEHIPKEVLSALHALEEAGHEAYIVGGCVRDLLRGEIHGEHVEPKDWDITTNATPEAIQQLFPESVYENTFGTVGVKTDAEDKRLKVIEITTFRKEEAYADKRHPEKVEFTDSVEEDLGRRDFTVNAMALAIKSHIPKSKTQKEHGVQDTRHAIRDTLIVDPFGGQEDLQQKLIRAVGDPRERLSEDALRLMRAPRFAAELDFSIEKETAAAIRENARLLREIAKERVRDELEKLLMAEKAAYGIMFLEKLDLLEHIIPELREGIGVNQNKHHKFTVFEHNLRALSYAAKKGYPLDVRIGALLHDVGKPRTKRGEGPDATFYGHEVVGARMARDILERLRFSKKVIERVELLIRQHMFVYDIGEVTEAGVRRLVRRVGPENMDDLFRLRQADRIGSGVPKAQPYRLRHLKFMVEKVSRDPISVGKLEIDGTDIMKKLDITPGPIIGLILNALLGEVLEDPQLNTKEYLIQRAEELATLDESELRTRAKKGKETRTEREREEEEEIKKKYYLK